MYEPSPDCFVEAPFHFEKGFFMCANQIGELMQRLLNTLLVHPPDAGNKPGSQDR
jgi:hypothetical protein